MSGKQDVLLFWTMFILCVGLCSCQEDPSKVYSLVYEDFNTKNFDACVRLTNGTSQVGCQSSLNGNVGVLFHYINSTGMDAIKSATTGPFAVLLPIHLLTSELVLALQGTNKVSGIVAYQYEDETGVKSGWSSASKCPNIQYGMYNTSYSEQYSTCGTETNQWNKAGNFLNDQDISIPVLVVTNDTTISSLTTCYTDHNNDLSTYPLCSVEMKSFTYSMQSSETCLRRNSITLNLAATKYCDEIGGNNIYGSVRATNFSKPLKNESVILLTAAIDARSFMNSFTQPGVNSATGFITLLSLAETFQQLTKDQKQTMNKDIAFLFLDGEAFDYQASKRTVFDILDNVYPQRRIDGKEQPAQFKLEHISNLIEFGQLGLVDKTVTGHYDPLSYQQDEAVKNQTDAVFDALRKQSGTLTFVRPSNDLPLPPSSLHTFLRKRTSTAILLSDFVNEYANKYYFGRFDTLYNIGIKFPHNATEDEVKQQLQPLAQKLTEIATASANAVYELAGGTDGQLTANYNTTLHLLYCVLRNDSCSYLNQFIADGHAVTNSNKPFNRYVGVYTTTLKPLTYYIQNILIRFIGEDIINVASKDCTVLRSNLMYQFLYFSDVGTNGTCTRAQVFALPGNSPKNYIKDYDFSTSEYQVWTEARWGSKGAFGLRMFLVNDGSEGILTLVAGLLMLVFSLVVVGIVEKQRKYLFSIEVEPL